MRKQAVRWFDGGASAACAVCARRAARTVARVERAPSPISVERCLECGSVRLVGSDDAFSDTDAVIDDYVEGGAGIDVIASGLCRAREGSVRRLLDVGCYYGFGVHVGARLFGWDAIGVEPTRAGARGRSELGVDIRSGSLDTVRDLGTFDLVLASEVVEHVTEPIDFLRRIRELLSPAGLLVLSTPAAEVVAPTRRDAEVLHALSPRNHRFLASARGLRTLLQRAGFGAFLVTRRDASLDAVAGHLP